MAIYYMLGLFQRLPLQPTFLLLSRCATPGPQLPRVRPEPTSAVTPTLYNKGPVSHSRKSREALDHIMQWHVHMYLAIRSQEWLLVTDSTSSMYGPRTQMGAQHKETSGVLW